MTARAGRPSVSQGGAVKMRAKKVGRPIRERMAHRACGRFPLQYPPIPSVRPMVRNADTRPFLAAACAAADCWFTAETCMMIFTCNRGGGEKT